MAMTDAEIREVAAALGQQIFVALAATAHSNLAELKQAVQNIDDAMNASCNQAATQHGAKLVKTALRDEAQTGASNLTNAEAAMALAYWALKEAGLL